MPYYPGIPLPTDVPAQSQPQILANFTQIDASFDVNHVALNAAMNTGMHTLVQLPASAAAHAGVAGIGQLFTRTIGGISALVWQHDAGAEIQMTGVDPTVGNPGITFLPGAMILMWGTTPNISNPAPVAYAYPTPFPHNTFSVFCQPILGGANSDHGWTISSIANTGFSITQLSAAPRAFYWLAIGN
jgi:hypothetical protein